MFSRVSIKAGRIVLLLTIYLFVALPVAAKELPDSQVIGMCYGPFRDGQDPTKGVYPTLGQIKEDFHIVKFMADYVRLYTVTKHTDKVLVYAEKEGLKVALGAWLGEHEGSNSIQVERLVSLANSHDNVLFVVVGNEAIFRKSKDYPDGVPAFKVIKRIVEVKKQVDVPVTAAEPWSIWKENPGLAKAVDFIYVNIHPYWENISLKKAAWHTYIKFKEVQEMYPEKRVIIGETGWPSGGQTNGPSKPSIAGQEKYTHDFLDIAQRVGIDFFFFEAFDEEYKKEEPNSVGPHWGLFFSNGKPKHSVKTLKINPEPGVLPERTVISDKVSVNSINQKP